MKKNNLLLGIILCVIFLSAFLLRFWRLGSIPVSMSDDETRLIYSAYSIWNTGKDLNGHRLPLTFVLDGYAFNPVPIYLASPFVGILGLSMFSGRLPFAVAGFATVILIFLIAKQLTKNNYLSALSAFILSVSVWHLTLSRFAYEGGLALFFFCLGVYLFFRIRRESFWLLVLSLFVFLFGFFSYSGYKLTFVPIIALLVWYKWKDLSKKQITVIMLGVALIFGLLFYLGKTQGALQYGGNLFFFQDKQMVEKSVELERRASLAPDKLKRLYHNKLTYIWNVFIRRYEYAFSPQYLFSDQEGSGVFSLWGRGQMYYADAALIFMGALYLFFKKRREFWLAIGFLIISPLPSGLGPEPVNYTIRASFMLPWLTILSGSGIYAISYFVSNKYLKSILYITVILWYVYGIGGYLTQYYFDWTKYSAKYYSKADQDLSYFLETESAKKRETTIYGVSSMTFLQYAFYSGLAPQQVQQIYKNTPIIAGNVTFKQKCQDAGSLSYFTPGQATIILPAYCTTGKGESIVPIKPSLIIKTLEAEPEWYVFSD